MNIKILLGVVLALVVIGAGAYYLSLSRKNNSPAVGLASSPKDATYIVEGQSVTLAGGISSDSPSHTTTRYFGNEASTGDLDGDGVADVGFVLTQSGGGSGTFYYAAVALKSAGGYVGTNAVLLGDRIAPQTTEIKDGVLVVNYADRKPGEPMTAQPSVGVSKYLLVKNGTLVETPGPTNHTR